MFVPKACLPVATSSPERRRKRRKTSDITGETTENAVDPEETASDDDDDAHAYLFRVREEALRLPNVWTADTTAETVRTKSSSARSAKKKKNDGVFGSMASTLQYIRQPPGPGEEIALRDVVPPPSEWHIPIDPKKWVEQTLSNFSELRSYLDQCGQHNASNPPQRKPVPPMKDTVAWCTYCLGSNHGYSEHESNNGMNPPDTPAAAWEIDIPPQGHAPTVRLLLQMDQVMVRRVLEHFTQYVVTVGTVRNPEDATASSQQHHGRSQVYPWIYALLARLAEPIHRDDAVTLYRLLKHLTYLRAQIPEANKTTSDLTTESTVAADRTFLATLNVLIVIVGIYFEQGGNYSNLMAVKGTTTSSS